MANAEKTKVAEEVQMENRLQFQKDEHARLLKAKEAIQAEIDKKSSDYAIHISQKDAESKRMRQEILDQYAQMEKDKKEFQEYLLEFQKQKAASENERETIKNEKAKLEQQNQNIREFIIAVQRACSLIGF